MENYLNPMKCNISSLNCKYVLYFIIMMAVLFAILLLSSDSKYSGISMLLSTICLILIFIMCTLLLMRLCTSNAPDMYSYVTLGSAFVVTILVSYFFRRNIIIQKNENINVK